MSYAAVTALIFAFVAIMHGWRIYIIPKPPAPREVGATCSSAKKSRLHSKPEEHSPDPPSLEERSRPIFLHRPISIGRRQFGCCCYFFSGVVVRPHARLSEASTWHKKRVHGEGVIEVGTDNEQRCPTC